MIMRDKVQPQGLCPWKLYAEAHVSHAKGAHPQGVSPSSLDAKASSRLRRNAKHETYLIDRREFEYRATPQFARRVNYSASP